MDITTFIYDLYALFYYMHLGWSVCLLMITTYETYLIYFTIHSFFSFSLFLLFFNFFASFWIREFIYVLTKNCGAPKKMFIA